MNDDDLTESGTLEGGAGAFPQTRWTLVRQATNIDEPESFDALSKLCEDYWYPLYAFLRREGVPPDDAADEVQGFFAVLLEKDFLEVADRDKGRLRTFLIDAIKKFRAKQFRARQAQKRGGGRIHVPIDQDWAEDRYHHEPADGLTPEQLLDRSWARLLLDEVMERLAAGFEAAEFAVTRQFLAWRSADTSYADAAARLGISEGNLKIRVHRMRAKYRVLLEEAVRDTLDQGNSEAVEEELKHLLAALG